MEEICIVGDSVVWGKHDPELGGWANRLRSFFDNFKIGDELRAIVYPLGIPGDTTEFALERIKTEFNDRAASIVIFALGKNDCAVNGKSQFNVSPEKYEENLRKMISISKEFTDKVLFLGLANVDESKTNPVFWDEIRYKNQNIKEYNSILEKICQEQNLTFIPMENVLDIKEDLYDGVHPNSKGHEKIFKRVFSYISKIIA